MATVLFDGATPLHLTTVPSSLVEFGEHVAHALELTPAVKLRYTCNGRPIDACNWVKLTDTSRSDSELLIRCHVRGGLLGGKGGFGANLKAAGRGPSRGTPYGLCRDLQGRRLGMVNNEMRLRAWLSDEEKHRREKLGESYEEPRGEDGISGWYLGVPSWAEHGKDRSKQVDQMLSRKKTTICKHWLEARATRSPPAGAPAWWGCPRGNGCKFAHGEEELRREAKVAAAIARRDESRTKQMQKLDSYTKGIFMYSDEHGEGGGSKSMLSSVMQGMQAGKTAAGNKRKRPEGGRGTHADRLPSSLPWNAATWVIPVSGEATDATIEYFPHTRADGSLHAHAIAEVEGLADFATVAVRGVSVRAPEAGASITAYYEVELVTNGVCQIGWCDSQFTVNMEEGDGVGDDLHTWAFDGARALKWNGTSTEYGQQWNEGDIVGTKLVLCTDADKVKGEIQFFLNSEALGKAFDLECDPTEVFFPAVSLEQGEIIRMNIGIADMQLSVGSVGSVSVVDYKNAALASPVRAHTNTVGVSSVDLSQKGAIPPVADEEKVVSDSVAVGASTSSASPAAAAPEPAMPADSLPVQQAVAAPAFVGPLNIDDVKDTKHLEALGVTSDQLKEELGARGLKVGGTWKERAERLMAVKGLAPDAVPAKLRGQGFPGPHYATK